MSDIISEIFHKGNILYYPSYFYFYFTFSIVSFRLHMQNVYIDNYCKKSLLFSITVLC